MSLLSKLLREMFRPKSAEATLRGSSQAINRVYIARDERQTVAFHVAVESAMSHLCAPLSFIPLESRFLPLERDEPSPAYFARMLVPWLCNFEGWALFMEPDMLVRADLNEVFDAADPRYAIMHPRSSEPAEWTSLMLFNCGHEALRSLTPEFVGDADALKSTELLFWLDSSVLGELPPEWNHTVAYDVPNARARIAHFPLGVPEHVETQGCEFSDEWTRVREHITQSLTWHELFGEEAHASVRQTGRTTPMACNDPLAGLGERLASSQMLAREAPTPPALSLRGRQAIAAYRGLHEKGLPEANLGAEDIFAGERLVHYCPTIAQAIPRTLSQTLLDYGCGKGTLHTHGIVDEGKTVACSLSEHFKVRKVDIYDPSLASLADRPTQVYDAVICTHVLEYCFAEDVSAVLADVFDYAVRFVFIAVDCERSANTPVALAPRTERSPAWWRAQVLSARRRHPNVVFTLMCHMQSQPTPVLIEG